jgi:TolA-binding protein
MATNASRVQNSARFLIVWLLAPLVAVAGMGCATDAQKKQLREGFGQLEAKQYDAATATANDYLRRYPSTPGTAEALYLRGRSAEQRPSRSYAESRGNLQTARTDYIAALSTKPPASLENYIRTSIGNVAFFQDDYATALAQWRYVYPRQKDPTTRAWTLYRIGLSLQRQGKFGDADATFDRVVRDYPGTLQASRAAEARGTRAFYVQVGAFAVQSSADRLARDLAQRGGRVSRQADPRGLHLVRLGPFGTYLSAMAERSRWLAYYPDARVVP